MAHFAKLDKANNVIQVVVVSNSDIMDSNGIEQESLGIEFLKKLYGENTNWVQTSYNAKFRKHYAGIAYKYDAVWNVFIPPKPFESWVLNEESYQWEAPFPPPPELEHDRYNWNESIRNWEYAGVEQPNTKLEL